MRIEIRNGRVVDPASGLDKPASVYVAASKIVGVGDAAPRSFQPEAVLDASGCVVCPGLIDLSARLREPGFEYKATLESEMAAAAAGGVTRLVCPPDTDPPLDEPGLVEMLRFRAQRVRGLTRRRPRVSAAGGVLAQMQTEVADVEIGGLLLVAETVGLRHDGDGHAGFA